MKTHIWPPGLVTNTDKNKGNCRNGKFWQPKSGTYTLNHSRIEYGMLDSTLVFNTIFCAICWLQNSNFYNLRLFRAYSVPTPGGWIYFSTVYHQSFRYRWWFLSRDSNKHKVCKYVKILKAHIIKWNIPSKRINHPCLIKLESTSVSYMVLNAIFGLFTTNAPDESRIL